MPIHEWTGREAGRQILHNRYAFWGLRSVADREFEPACTRLAGDVFVPRVTPKFRIAPDDPIFAMGSCFARAIEEHLRPRGFRVESDRDEDFLEFADDRRQDIRHTEEGPTVEIECREITNKYNTFSMLQQLQWVFERGVEPASTFLPIGDGLVQDPHVCAMHRFADVETTTRRRAVLTSLFQRLAHCRLLVVTLGLTEVWFDRETHLHLNATPDRAALKAMPDRFSFRVTSFQENRDCLERLHELATRVAPGIKLLVTVSPVALAATFRPVDVVIANMASKATLRAVADDWAASHDDVDYFPSFEMVMHSNPAAVRKADRSHVTAATSSAIVDLFARHYVEPARGA